MTFIETETTDNSTRGTGQLLASGNEVALPAPETQPPQVSMIRAMLYAPFRPAWVGERTAHLSLKRAWLIHFTAAITTIAVIFAVILWGKWSSYGPTPITRVIQEATQEIGFLLDELYRYPIESVLSVLGIVALVDGSHLLIALVFMSWGARDEPLRQSFGFAVRQIWLASTRFVIAAIIFGGPLGWMEHQDRSWRMTNPGPTELSVTSLRRPTLKETDPTYAKVMADYEAELSAAQAEWRSYWEARREWLATRPWYLHRREAIGIPLGFLTALWVLWALLRSIGATRNVPPITRDPRCIDCGYNLHTIPMDSRCPECGKPVIESLGPDVHPGTPWTHRKPGQALQAWCKCAIDVVRTPETFGQSLCIGNPGITHRRFFAISLVAVWLVGAGAMLAIFYLMNAGDFSGQPELALIIPIVAGTLCLAGTLAVACASAMLIGMSQSLTHQRNLLPSAMQIASYLGGFLVLWAIIGATLIVMLVWLEQANMLRAMARTIGLHSELFTTLLFCVPNFLCAAFFLNRIAVATTASRFANK